MQSGRSYGSLKVTQHLTYSNRTRVNFSGFYTRSLGYIYLLKKRQGGKRGAKKGAKKDDKKATVNNPNGYNGRHKCALQRGQTQIRNIIRAGIFLSIFIAKSITSVIHSISLSDPIPAAIPKYSTPVTKKPLSTLSDN
jgi:hypothetical protein